MEGMVRRCAQGKGGLKDGDLSRSSASSTRGTIVPPLINSLTLSKSLYLSGSLLCLSLNKD